MPAISSEYLGALWSNTCEVACTQGLTGKMVFTAPAQSILKSSGRATQRCVCMANIGKAEARQTPCLQKTGKRQQIPNKPAFKSRGREKQAALHSAALSSSLPGCRVEEQLCSLAGYSWHTPPASAPRQGRESSSLGFEAFGVARRLRCTNLPLKKSHSGR